MTPQARRLLTLVAVAVLVGAPIAFLALRGGEKRRVLAGIDIGAAPFDLAVPVDAVAPVRLDLWVRYGTRAGVDTKWRLLDDTRFVVAISAPDGSTKTHECRLDADRRTQPAPHELHAPLTCRIEPRVIGVHRVHVEPRFPAVVPVEAAALRATVPLTR